jgi:hypothetical protein
MTQNAPADPPSSGPPPAGPRPGRGLDNLWIAASSPQLTIALAVLLAFTCASAAVLPQLLAGSDPLAASRWLATTAARYGRFGAFFSSSGLFNVLAGPWISALLALSAFHLTLRVANQARHLAARRARSPIAPQGLPFELVYLPAGMDAVQRQVEELAAGRQGSSVTADPSDVRPKVDAYLERRSWAVAGPLLTYLGPLLLVLGLLWNALDGWRASDVTLIPGRTVQPAQAGGLALGLVDAGGDGGARPGVISLARGSQARYAWLGYGRPAIWGPVWVAQRNSGPALAVRASANGIPLPVEALENQATPVESLHLRFGQAESEQAFTIPARALGADTLGPAEALAFRVVSYESLADRGIGRPVFLVEGYQGTDPAPGLNELVEDNRVIEWQGVVLTLQREAYVVVDVAAMPGLPLLLLGALALLVGAAVTAWGGLTRTWLNAAAERDGSVLAVRVAAPAVGQAEVGRIAAGLVARGEGDRPVSEGVTERWRHALYVLAGTLVLVGLGALALRRIGPLGPQVQGSVLILHAAFAAVALGALAVAAGQSVWFAMRGNRLSDVADPMLRGSARGLRGRAGDPGRAIALAAFPLLTGALLLGSLWGLFVLATPVAPVAAEMWLLVAWLLAAAYLHATSGWRPLRAPAWLAPVLVMAALLAGTAACLAAPSLLTL